MATKKKLWKPNTRFGGGKSGTKPGQFYVYDTGLRKFYKTSFKTIEAAREARQHEIEHFKVSMSADLTDNYEIYQRVK